MGGKNSTPASSSSSATSSSSSSHASSSSSTASSSSASSCVWCGLSGAESLCGRCGGVADGGGDVSVVHLSAFFETLPTAEQAASDERLAEVYGPPFIAATLGKTVGIGARFQIRESDFKVSGCQPPHGIVTSRTRVRFTARPLHALRDLQKVHVLPTAATLPDERPIPADQLFAAYIKPFLTASPHSSCHLSDGDTFLSNGLQFKVIAANPPDGLVTRDTEVFADGDPIADLRLLHILPIFESLPNNEKRITPSQSFSKYISPFFSGRFLLLKKSEPNISIDGVDFRIVAMEPNSGIVTLKTEIHTNGDPLRADDIKRQQEEDDEAMARQMQQAEGTFPYPPPFPFDPTAHLSNGPLSFQRPMRPNNLTSISADDLRQRLGQMLRQMPQQHHQRIVVQRLYDTLNTQSGATPADISALPTRTFHSKTVVRSGNDDEKSDNDREHLHCMVCLCDYEDGETLRTLPCFHSYHAGCIDQWLKKDKKCPICKNSISQVEERRANG